MPSERPRVYSVADLARASGLGRTYVYYLIQTGILPPMEPRAATRIRFDENTLQLAKIFADLQRRRGVTPKGLVKLVHKALDTSISHQLEPLRSRMAGLSHQIMDILRNALEARRSRPRSSSGSVSPDEVLQAADKWRAYLADVAERAVNAADHYLAAEQEYREARNKLLKAPLNDRAWEILDPLFESARQRHAFLSLLSETGVLRRLMESRAEAILDEEETIRGPGRLWRPTRWPKDEMN